MAESSPSASIEEWVYQPLSTDTEELREAFNNLNFSSFKDLDIDGEFYDSTPCHFKSENDGNTIIINGEQITHLRGFVLKTVEKENNAVRYCVQISTKINDIFVWFKIYFASPADALKVCTLCKKLLFKPGGYVNILSPKWTGKLNIAVTDTGNEKEEAKTEEYTVILDEEGLFVFRNLNKRVPDYCLLFYKDSTDNSLEKALIQHMANTISLESLTKKFVIHNASEHRAFADALKSIKPKPMDIFKDHASVVQYFSSLEKPVQEFLDVAAYPRTTMRRYDDEQGTSYQRADEFAPVRNQTTIISDELDKAEAILSQEEEVSLPWIIAEDEIRLMLQNEEAFDSSQKDMISGGLDPNSPDHLMKCFTEIEEHLINQRYDLALSRLRGTKTIFLDSDIAEIKALINKDDIDLLRKLYYHYYNQG